LIAPLLASPGCGGSGDAIWVTGKLLKGGTRYVAPEDQTVNVTFVSIETRDGSGKTIPGGEPYLADFDEANATFTVPGPDGRGIPAGKYRVSVVQKIKRVALEKLKVEKKLRIDRETDMLKNAFGPDRSPIVRELTASCDLAIDLDRPGDPTPPR
jgi:hypothetical protein